MRRKFLCIAAIILQAIAVFAQNVDSVQYIDEVSISALKQQFHVCGKTETIDSLAMAMSSGGSLTDMINVNLPLYIKQDAGGLSTIRFRGASPDHTAIIFEGINLNSLTLGHSNASNISSFLFDEIKVQYGSSASMYGSGAVGGSIHLNSSPKWINGFDFQLQQNIGSFSNYFNGIKLRYGNSFLNCSFKLFRKNATNDFPFENIAVFDFEKQTFVNDYMKNLAISNYGGLAEIELKQK